MIEKDRTDTIEFIRKRLAELDPTLATVSEEELAVIDLLNMEAASDMVH